MPVLLIGLLLLLLEVALFLHSGSWESFTWYKMTEDFWTRHPESWTGLQWVLHRVAVSWSLIVVGACATYYRYAVNRYGAEVWAEMEAERLQRGEYRNGFERANHEWRDRQEP